MTIDANLVTGFQLGCDVGFISALIFVGLVYLAIRLHGK